MDDIRLERPAAGTAVVVFEGEHDLTSRPELEELLTSLIGENGHVVADLSEAEFVDSTIINLLVQAKREASERDCAFRLQMGTQSIVRRVFEVTGVLDALDCASTRAEALGSTGE
jgi:anti-anti-sigma factor